MDSTDRLVCAVTALVAALGPEPHDHEVEAIMRPFAVDEPKPKDERTQKALRTFMTYRDGYESFSWAKIEKDDPALAATVRALYTEVVKWREARDRHNQKQRTLAVQDFKLDWARTLIDMAEVRYRRSGMGGVL